MTYKWLNSSQEKIDQDLLELAQGDTLLGRLLINREIKDKEAAKYYLDLGSLSERDPNEVPEIDIAFQRVCKAIDSKEKILIYGDYDVDGTTSVALLYRAFKMIGIQVETYIPSRHTEGYGLNKDAVTRIKNEFNVDLLITCDCGISNHTEVAHANDLGLDVIVTDHHSIPEVVPPSVANCNPKTLPADHPLHWLPGVGVAYKLAQLILEEYSDDHQAYSESLLDLVALGMIADLAPLRAENRLLVDKGLRVLAQTEKVGLQELMKACGIKLDPDTEHIGFGIAPRINAAGRLADANKAVRLMITEDRSEAFEIAEYLDQENKNRQKLCEEIFHEAEDLIAEQIDLKQDLCIALAKEGWHHGVIGIVASRLVEKYNLPVFIIAIEENIAKGSSRGIKAGDLDLFLEMQKIQEEKNLFLKFGGHKAAAGFSCEKEKVQELCKTLIKHFTQKLQGEDIRKSLQVDTALRLQEVHKPLLKRIGKLAPYGFENRQALFISGPLKVMGLRPLGKEEKHLKLFLKDESLDSNSGRKIEGVIWNRAREFMDKYAKQINFEITAVYSPRINDYMGEQFIQLDIKDWKDPNEVSGEFFSRFQKNQN